jgi:Domain of unknown function (DUF4410)
MPLYPPTAAFLRTYSLLALSAAFAIAANAQGTVQKVMVGNATVTVLQSYQGATKLAKPTQTLVYDFAVPPDAITIDDSAAGRLSDRGPLHRLRGDSGQNSDPNAVAAKVQSTFTQNLVKALQKTTIPAMAATASTSDAGAQTLVVRGEFTAVDEGNKTKRIMIGFGRGASDVKAHTTVTLITPTGPVVLGEFTLNSASGKKPGAAATMGASSAGEATAASDATDRKSTVEGDAARMAKAVAKEIQNLMAGQQWIPATTQSTSTTR